MELQVGMPIQFHHILTMKVQIALAEIHDLPAWSTLASEVVPLFGPMPEFETILERKIEENRAYCAKIKGNGLKFAGGILLGGAGKKHWIRWLAVSAEFRQFGIGRLLVAAAMENTPQGSDLLVDTFAAGSSGGEAARQLYKSYGFEPIGFVEVEGMHRERFRRSATS
ncbi:GNAT family N-acetyltransferase [Yoonia sp. BS5-3]|uniref:GNAT family N-acetyltransferase n=1 Tax=Yoonia phaeophyticola TaxID=3137369 RepID=A0ABZ2V0G6_9RHOB